jgi:hypothetical protein
MAFSENRATLIDYPHGKQRTLKPTSHHTQINSS